jgi:hypothetical protein
MPLPFRNLSRAAAPLMAAVASLFGVAAAHAQSLISRGVYVDGAGARHPWSVNGAHTLVWDDRPFVPVGGLFQARSWTPSPTEADWQSDVAALAALKAKNVTDIYLQPARGGLTGVKPEAIQRLLDRLDADGFTYGISINDGPKDILTGYVVRPGAFRAEAPQQGGSVPFRVDNIASSLYLVVSKTGADIIQSGDADMVADGARVRVPPLTGDYVVFLIPRKVYFAKPTGGGLGLPDLWGGFDTYRDSLLTLFKQVKPGKGFRFFVDALPPDLTVSGGEVEHLVPQGVGFLSEWEEWLTRRYKNTDTLQARWGITDREVKNFKQAARLVPLWGGGKGAQAFYDPSTVRQIRSETTRSTFWRDLDEFKVTSVRGYMNDLATVLKRSVADVPVVYRSRGYSPLFGGPPTRQGFDGIGIEAYGRGAELVTGAAGYVYAQAAETSKTLWLPVISTADAPPANKTAKGYTSLLTLHSDLNWLREIGARGFYVNGVRVTDAARKAFDLSDSPEQLTWLADYARMLVATGVASVDTVPKAVFYPRGLASATLRPLTGGAWWLPTDRPGVAYDFGPVGRAYSMMGEDGGVVYYLFNPTGPRRIRLKIPKASRLPNGPRVGWSESAEGELNKSKDVLTLTIGPDPVRIVNLASLPVPTDAFAALLEETQSLAKAMRRGNNSNMDAGRFEVELSAVRARYNEDQPYIAVSELLTLRNVLRDSIRQYAWIEGEGEGLRKFQHTFDEVSDRAGASGGRILEVDLRPVGAPPATASYQITAKDTAAYQVWVAASPDAPLSFRLDEHPMLDQATLPRRAGTPYANGTLVWTYLGSATIPKGTHTLEMRADGPVAVDVILLTPHPFTPDGPNPPPVEP